MRHDPPFDSFQPPPPRRSAPPDMLGGNGTLAHAGAKSNLQMASQQEGGGCRQLLTPHVPDSCMAPVNHTMAGQPLLSAQNGASTEPSEG